MLHEIVYILLVYVAELLGTVAAARGKKKEEKNELPNTKFYTLKYVFLPTHFSPRHDHKHCSERACGETNDGWVTTYACG